MCGICGILRDDQGQVDQQVLRNMNQANFHRGPDGDGFYFAPGVGLAMRRLAIIDLNTGDQPICNEDETIWIVFNGEIFNFNELRNVLEQRGHQFRTQTDTECILHLYEDHGENCLQYLRGQFAFAIWDQTHQRLFLARDRFGQKPLYYAWRNSCLYFSSELPSLLAGLPINPEIDLDAIDLYLSLQYIPEPRTPFHGVSKLPAAHKMICELGEHRIAPYWHLNYQPKHRTVESELIEELRQLLTQAVRLRMISDVPLGAHLSGGIDSSIIVALMAEASSRPVKTFSVGFEETSFSEIPHARAVARLYGTDHQEFTLKFDDVPDTLEKLISHFGEPFADPSAIPLFYLSKLTREYVTVALNGDGGDEAFGGYQRYWLDPWANRYNRLPGWVTGGIVPGMVRWLPDKGDRPQGNSLVNGLKRLEQLTQIDARASILRWGSYFSPDWKRRLWREPRPDQVERILVNQFETASAVGFLDRTLSTDVHTYLPGDLLVKADRMTMANSLEGRSPFLDHYVAEWAARLPQKWKTRGLTGKYLLRKAFTKELPTSVQKRGKQGFGIPVGRWFREPLAGWARDVLFDDGSLIHTWFQPAAVKSFLAEHQEGRYDHGKRIYALVMLALWAREFG